ncbi:MAG: hypothetical protein DRZ79_00870 [Candidatus Cloacimonadota bacterium]|nr:MAG: hypothetical protein DRZ79_00870 [Candidatus Cloacimonadota bacterium]
MIHFQQKLAQTNNLIKENTLLKEKLLAVSTEIDSILTRLKLMENWEDEIRSEKKLKAINKDLRNMGIGGYPQIDSTFSFLGEEFSQSYNLTLFKLRQLEGKINFDFNTHRELMEQVKLKNLLYRNTPSIYPTYGRISDGFGWRKHPITHKRSFHHGLDFANKIGTPIYATADGVVKKTGREKYFGRYIIINHKFGYQTKYAHLSKYIVKKGQTVKRGQIIGFMGNSGRSTGAHLHYEVLRYGRYRNPYKYLNKSEDDIVLSKRK